MIPKIIFIVPYRDREHEKHHFSIYMKYLMEDYDENDYEIYFSHQCDKRPFNRGATKNIGFLAIKEKYPDDYKDITLVFNDIDTFPVKKNILNYKTKINTVKHFYGFNFALGGIFSIVGSDFEKCNGFPNNWGWGLEDNEMKRRCDKNNIKINRDIFFNYKDKNIIHIFDNTTKRFVNDDEITNTKYNNCKDNLDTIKNLEYNIVNNNIITNCNNQYIINITRFNTLLTHDTNNYYIKDLKINNRLYPNQRKKQVFGLFNRNNFR